MASNPILNRSMLISDKGSNTYLPYLEVIKINDEALQFTRFCQGVIPLFHLQQNKTTKPLIFKWKVELFRLPDMFTDPNFLGTLDLEKNLTLTSGGV